MQLPAPSLIRDIGFNVTIPIVAGTLAYVFTPALPLILKNFLADGLWAYAFISLILIVWDRHLNVIWIIITFFSAMGFEIAQFFHFISGTGDFADITVYVIVFIIGLTLNKYFRSKYANNNNYD